MAIQLAKAINTEIICADSRIVYKDLDIVSAKPDIKERQGICHHLTDIKEPDEDFSAGDFVYLAQNIIKNSKKPIIISGGTWFYIKSLLDDVKLPECPIDIELRKTLEKKDSKTLWLELNEIDPLRAQKIHHNNKDKIIRSIELCKLLKQPISAYVREKNENYDAKWFIIKINREKLYQNINSRVDKMIDDGLFNEWERNDKKYGKTKIICNTIGYKEFYELKDGIYTDFDMAVEKIKQHTRNFAKRQLTYFKSNQKIKSINNYGEILKECDL